VESARVQATAPPISKTSVPRAAVALLLIPPRMPQVAGSGAERVQVSDLRLAAVLIVRDESDALPGCLASLAGVVDEVRVYDTGSTDGTPELAARLGATVTRGGWDDDFAAARNAAQQGWQADWALAVDADQRYTGDPATLRAMLAGCPAEVVRVEIDNAHDELPYTHAEGRLHRPGRTRWQGRVHERLTTTAGTPPSTAAAPRTAIVLAHQGYATPQRRVAKALRNAALARQSLDEVTDRAQIARTLLDLGRSLVGAGRRQQAVDTFETLRELFPGTPEWVQGTDFLARLVLAAGMDEACLTLVGQLRAAGAPGPYCDWLAAQSLAQLGDVPTAARLLSGVTEVVDTAGRRHHPRALHELRDLVDRLHRSAAR
jgi:glycosyl transferase family 2